MPDIGRKTPEQNVHLSYLHPTIVFVTLCTKDRRPWLAQAQVQRSLEEIWKNAPAWMVGRYVLMPDHLHLFCAPYELEVPLDKWISYWKRKFSVLHLPDTGAWQRSGWHHRLRREESYDEKWEYVRDNPMRAGMAGTQEEWPYQGEMNILRW